MTIDVTTALEAAGAAVTAIGGVYGLIRHVVASSRRKKEEYRDSILKRAKEEMSRIEAELEEKIKDLKAELEAQKESVSKDLSHLKEIYNAEIKTLGEKIDELRSSLQEHQTSMVALLTKLVNSK